MKASLRFAVLFGLWIGLAAQTAVVSKTVYLRQNPSIRQRPITKLKPSVELELLDEKPTGGFYHVETEDGDEGWVWGRNIEIQEPIRARPSSHRNLHAKKTAKKAGDGWGASADAGGGGSRGDGGGGGGGGTLPPINPTLPPPPSIPSFPWPPPGASASEGIPNELLAASATLGSLGDVNMRLAAALDKNGYAEKKYYAVPNGFALVTRLEQIDAEGRAKPEPDRWSSNLPEFKSLGDYLHALFFANPGYYRLIVFIVTDVPFAESEKRITEVEAGSWLRAGLNRLPQAIADRPYNKDVVSTALIYEFRKDQGKDPQLNEPSRLGAREHLVHSGIWSALGGAL